MPDMSALLAARRAVIDQFRPLFARTRPRSAARVALLREREQMLRALLDEYAAQRDTAGGVR